MDTAGLLGQTALPLGLLTRSGASRPPSDSRTAVRALSSRKFRSHFWFRALSPQIKKMPWQPQMPLTPGYIVVLFHSTMALHPAILRFRDNTICDLFPGLSILLQLTVMLPSCGNKIIRELDLPIPSYNLCLMWKWMKR